MTRNRRRDAGDDGGRPGDARSTAGPGRLARLGTASRVGLALLWRAFLALLALSSAAWLAVLALSMWRVTLAVLAVAALTLVIVTWDTLKYRVLG